MAGLSFRTEVEKRCEWEDVLDKSSNCKKKLRFKTRFLNATATDSQDACLTFLQVDIRFIKSRQVN